VGGDDSHHGVLVSTRNPPTLCISCDSMLDAASMAGMDAEPVEPRPGDITICLYCGQMLMFDDDACPTLKPTDEQLKQCDDEQLALALRLRHFYSARAKH